MVKLIYSVLVTTVILLSYGQLFSCQNVDYKKLCKKLFDNGKLTKGNCIDENTFKLCTERCKEFLNLDSSTKECPFGDAKRNCDKVIKKEKCQGTCSNLDTHEKEKYGKNCCGTCIRKCGYAPDPLHKKTYYQNLIAQGRK